MDTSERETEGHEVTCPFCAQMRTFPSISGPEGAGTWLSEHREFHQYELLMIHLEEAFSDFSNNSFEGGE